MIPFGPELWLFDGPVVTGAVGFWFPTRMAVIRLPVKGRLWIWSPVALTEDIRTAVDALGPVSHLVARNKLHHMFLADWAHAYPDARVHAAPGLTPNMAGTAIHETIADDTHPDWDGEIDQVILRGNRITTEAVFFHRQSATVLVTDFVQQLPKDWYHGWRAWVARRDLMTSPVPTVPRKFRLATTDKAKAREGVSRVLDWPADRLVMAHGAPIQTGGRRALQHAFGWLMQ